MLDPRRRQFITLLGGAAAWPLAARAQSVVPIIGFLDSKSARDSGQTVAAFHRGLNEVAFIDGQNVAIEYRWTDVQRDGCSPDLEGVEGAKASRGRGWHACA
jgi:putative tryptophan/tyrosine transport system substrate-binding protein